VKRVRRKNGAKKKVTHEVGVTLFFREHFLGITTGTATKETRKNHQCNAGE